MASTREATSELAKYVFDPKNYKIFEKLIIAKTPSVLLKELNEKKISEEQIKQFKTVTSHQEEYKTLFELPPAQWFSILIEEKTSGEDLVSLIDNDIGAFSGVLDFILELPNKETCVKSLFFLKSSPAADEKQIKNFLNKIQYPSESQASFLSLHGIFHNTVIEQKIGGYLVSKRPATQVFLRIDANHADKEQARVQAALRIMRECITYHHDRVLQSLPQEVQKRIAQEEEIIKKEQEKLSLEKKDADEVKRVFRELNGDRPNLFIDPILEDTFILSINPFALAIAMIAAETNTLPRAAAPSFFLPPPPLFRDDSMDNDMQNAIASSLADAKRNSGR